MVAMQSQGRAFCVLALVFINGCRNGWLKEWEEGGKDGRKSVLNV